MAGNGLTLGTWADTERSIGQVVAELTGPDEVTRADLRRRLEVLAWDCPLHHDDDVARAHGYREAVAPATMLMTWVLPPYWSPGDAAPTLTDPPLFPSLGLCRVPAPGEAGFVTSCETEYFEPVYPGDRITATSVPTKVTRKTLSVGDGAFICVTTTYTKQTGELVGIERVVIFRYTPAPHEAVPST
jgi:acyl dehydratase